MAQPLYEDSVTYADGTPATVDQMARDVAHFLMWAAEPKLETRKHTGIKVLIFLVVFTGVLYRSEEHTSELQSLMRTSYAVFCLKKKNTLALDQYTMFIG